MARINERLAPYAAIGLDTSIFIYHFEAHPRYLPLTTPILQWVRRGESRGIISAVTLMELTVLPWRLERSDIARQYETLLLNFPNLYLVDVDRHVARRAAQLRAAFNLRPADALQPATALIGGATALVTNDRRLTRLAGVLDIILLDDFVDPE